MAKKVVVELTVKEAEELRFVAGNGFANGDIYDGCRKKSKMKHYGSAMKKLEEAIEKSINGKFTYRMGF